MGLKIMFGVVYKEYNKIVGRMVRRQIPDHTIPYHTITYHTTECYTIPCHGYTLPYPPSGQEIDTSARPVHNILQHIIILYQGTQITKEIHVQKINMFNTIFTTPTQNLHSSPKWFPRSLLSNFPLWQRWMRNRSI